MSFEIKSIFKEVIVAACPVCSGAFGRLGGAETDGISLLWRLLINVQFRTFLWNQEKKRKSKRLKGNISSVKLSRSHGFSRSSASERFYLSDLSQPVEADFICSQTERDWSPRQVTQVRSRHPQPSTLNPTISLPLIPGSTSRRRFQGVQEVRMFVKAFVVCVGAITPLTHVKLSKTIVGEVLEFLCTGSDATVPVVSDIVPD